jgi:N-acetylglucosaminyldiphosphoundecaprenol N-acetyl-beta-D-mannosaminyltransferase
MKTITILGINIAAARKNEITDTIEKWLSETTPRRIVTPNPEIILAAQKDEEYFHILNRSDLAIPDGIGLKFAAFAMGERLNRVTGSDLTLELIGLAEKTRRKVAVLNWRGGLSTAAQIKNALNGRFPGLDCLVLDIDREWTMPYYNEVNQFKPDIIFTALGAPWQDKFNYRVMKSVTGVKLAIGVGGSFDFLTGQAVRAPKPLRLAGLEWLWRLYKQPGRYKRIWRAIVIFPLVFLRWRFIQPLLYRPSVAVMLFKKMPDDYHFLVVERSEEPGHWQLPQGGREGESAQAAGLRELSEEINCLKFKPVVTYENIYKYKFGERESESSLRSALSKKHTGYKGQKQSLLICEFTGADKDISVNYWDHTAWKWAKRADLLKEVHPIRKEATTVFLKKFDESLKIKT